MTIVDILLTLHTNKTSKNAREWCGLSALPFAESGIIVIKEVNYISYNKNFHNNASRSGEDYIKSVCIGQKGISVIKYIMD